MKIFAFLVIGSVLALNKRDAACHEMEKVGDGCCRFNNIDVFSNQYGQTVDNCKRTCLENVNCWGADTSQPMGGAGKFECFHFLAHRTPPTRFTLGCSSSDTCYKKVDKCRKLLTI